MADRITQLQDLVTQQAENILASVSCIEKQAEPYIFPEIERRKPKLSKKEKQLLKLQTEKNAEKEAVNEEMGNNERKTEKQIDYPSHFAKKIAEVAIDINTLIDSLPDDSLISPELQVGILIQYLALKQSFILDLPQLYV